LGEGEGGTVHKGGKKRFKRGNERERKGLEKRRVGGCWKKKQGVRIQYIARLPTGGFEGMEESSGGRKKPNGRKK